MKKKILAIFLAALMVMSVVPMSVFAAGSIEGLIKVEQISLRGYDVAYRYYADVDPELTAAARTYLQTKDASVLAQPKVAKFIEDYCGGDYTKLETTKYTFNVEKPEGAEYELWGTNVAEWIKSNYTTVPAELVECKIKEGNILKDQEPSLFVLIALGEFTCAVKNIKPATNDGKQLKVNLGKSEDGVIFTEVPGSAKEYKFTKDLPIKVQKITLAGYSVAYKYYLDVDAEIINAARTYLKTKDASVLNNAKVQAFITNYCGDVGYLSDTFFTFNVTVSEGAQCELYGTDVEGWYANNFDKIPLKLAKCDNTSGDILEGFEKPNLLQLVALGEFTCAVKNTGDAPFDIKVELGKSENDGAFEEITELTKKEEDVQVTEEEQLVLFEEIVLEGYDMAYKYTANVSPDVTEGAKQLLRVATQIGVSSQDLLNAFNKACNDHPDFKEFVEAHGGPDCLYTKYNFEVSNPNNAEYDLYGTDVEHFLLNDGEIKEELRKCPENAGELLKGSDVPSLLLLLALREFKCGVKNTNPENNATLQIQVDLYKDADKPEAERELVAEVSGKTYTFPKVVVNVEKIEELEGYDVAYKYSVNVSEDAINAARAYITDKTLPGTEVLSELQSFLGVETDEAVINALTNKTYNFNIINKDNAKYTLYGTDVSYFLTHDFTDSGELAELEGVTEGKLLNEENGEVPNLLILIALGEVTCAVKNGANGEVAKDKAITVELLENGQRIDVKEYIVAHHFAGKWEEVKEEDGYYYYRTCEDGTQGWIDADGYQVEKVQATNLIATQYLKTASTNQEKLDSTRYIVKLTEDQINKCSAIKLVFRTAADEKVEATVDCSYTSFLNDGAEITAESMGCAAFAIITVPTPSDNNLVSAYEVYDEGADVLIGARLSYIK